MQYLLQFMPSWIEGLFHIVSRIGKIVWMVIQSTWHVLVFMLSALWLLWQALQPLIDTILEQSGAMVAVLTNASTAMQDAAEAGWPPEFANGVFFANQHVPLAEMLGMILALSILYITCTLVRVIKSILRPGS